MPDVRKLLAGLLLLTPFAGAADPALLDFIMPDARVVVGIDIAHIRSSPLNASLSNGVKNANPEIQKLLEAAGFDPLRDLQEILFASPGIGKNPPALLVARGTFDVAKLRAFAELAGSKISDFGGVPILSDPEKDSGAFALLDNIILGGNRGQVEAAIGRRGRGLILNTEMATRISALSRRYDAWLVSIAPLATMASNLPQDAKLEGLTTTEALRAMEQFSLGISMKSDLSLAAEFVMVNAKAAGSIADGLQMMMGIAQKGAKEEPGLMSILKNLNLGVERNVVHMGFTVPVAEVEKAVQSAMNSQMKKSAPVTATRKPAAGLPTIQSERAPMVIREQQTQAQIPDTQQTQTQPEPAAQAEAQPATQPVAQPGSETAGQPVAQPTTQPVAQPGSETAGRPVADPATQPVAQPGSETAVQPMTHPATQPVAQPGPETAGQPVADPATQPVAQPGSETAGQSVAGPATQPVAEPGPETAGQPVADPAIQPVAQTGPGTAGQPVAQPATQPVAQPGSETAGQPVADPATQPVAQPGSETAGQSVAQPAAQPRSETAGQTVTQPATQPVAQPGSETAGQPVAQPAVQSVAQPGPETAGQPVADPATQPVAQPGPETAGQPVAQFAAQPVAQPGPETAGQPVAQPATQPVAQPGPETAGQPVADPGTQPVTQPGSETAVQPMAQPELQPAARPAAERAQPAPPARKVAGTVIKSARIPANGEILIQSSPKDMGTVVIMGSEK